MSAIPLMRRPSPLTRMWTVASPLIPWAAFVTVLFVDDGSGSVGHLAAVALGYLAFVGLPAALPVAMARSRAMRLVALSVMTAVSTISAVVMTGSDYAQAGLVALWVPYVALPLAAVIWTGESVAVSRAAARRRSSDEAAAPVSLVERLAALVIDAAIVGAALGVPLTALSDAKKEVAAVVVGVAVVTAYFAGFTVTRGRTVGQSLLGLTVVDAQTLGRLPVSRAVARGLIVGLEVAAVATIILSPAALAEAIAIVTTGRSLTDHVVRTAVTRAR